MFLTIETHVKPLKTVFCETYVDAVVWPIMSFRTGLSLREVEIEHWSQANNWPAYVLEMVLYVLFAFLDKKFKKK